MSKIALKSFGLISWGIPERKVLKSFSAAASLIREEEKSSALSESASFSPTGITSIASN